MVAELMERMDLELRQAVRAMVENMNRATDESGKYEMFLQCNDLTRIRQAIYSAKPRMKSAAEEMRLKAPGSDSAP